MDEIMRGLQSDPAEAPPMRFGALSVWMVLVGLLLLQDSVGPGTEI